MTAVQLWTEQMCFHVLQVPRIVQSWCGSIFGPLLGSSQPRRQVLPRQPPRQTPGSAAHQSRQVLPADTTLFPSSLLPRLTPTLFSTAER